MPENICFYCGGNVSNRYPYSHEEFTGGCWYIFCSALCRSIYDAECCRNRARSYLEKYERQLAEKLKEKEELDASAEALLKEAKSPSQSKLGSDPDTKE